MAALQLNDTFAFGKWKGKSVRDIAVNVPDYIQFLMRDRPSMFDGSVRRVLELPNRMDRARLADELLLSLGPVYSEDEHYSQKNVPFPPMCSAEDIPF